MMVLAIQCLVLLTFKMAENPKKVSKKESHLSSSGHPAKPLSGLHLRGRGRVLAPLDKLLPPLNFKKSLDEVSDTPTTTVYSIE